MSDKNKALDKGLEEQKAEHESALGFPLNEGELFIDKDGGIYHISSWKRREKDGRFEYRMAYMRNGEARHYGTSGLADFLPNHEGRRKYTRVHTRDLDQLFTENESLVRDPSLLVPDEATANHQERALQTAVDMKAVNAYTSAIQAITDRAAIVSAVLARKKHELWVIQNDLQGKLGFVSAIMDIIDAFLGTYEEITQLQEGEQAPYNSPIVIYQGIRYFDEEVGNVSFKRGEEYGLDWRDVGEFDKWLLKSNHLDRMIPDAKGVVAFKPTRQRRNYGDAFANMFNRDQNQRIYLLIRNGQNVYRIWTGLAYEESLYPLSGTFEAIYKSVTRHNRSDELSPDQQRKIWKEQAVWRQRIALLQGLIMRTDVFHPCPQDIDFFDDQEVARGRIKLINDLETSSLPSGIPSFKEWVATINAEITKGSRIVFSISNRYSESKTWRRRFDGQWRRVQPDYPRDGVYTVVEVSEKGGRSDYYRAYRILYMPSSEVVTDYYWGSTKERERRTSFWLYEDRSDKILNYDLLTADDIEHYLDSRFERRHYTEVLPILYKAYREFRAEEAEEQRIVGHMSRLWGIEPERLAEPIQWWKTRNKTKRPISDDESKAWRMIYRRIFNKAWEHEGASA